MLHPLFFCYTPWFFATPLGIPTTRVDEEDGDSTSEVYYQLSLLRSVEDMVAKYQQLPEDKLLYKNFPDKADHNKGGTSSKFPSSKPSSSLPSIDRKVDLLQSARWLCLRSGPDGVVWFCGGYCLPRCLCTLCELIWECLRLLWGSLRLLFRCLRWFLGCLWCLCPDHKQFCDCCCNYSGTV